MKTMWNIVDKMNITAYHKSRVYIVLNTILGLILGAVIWLLIHSFALNGIDWMLVFTCYPGFAMLVISIYYLYNHDFES